MTPRSSPCISGDAAGTTCLVGLLLGVACCPDGDCALCRADRARARRLGFSQDRVDRDFARRRAKLLTSCPTCGHPPPPPVLQLPPLPRLDRPDRVASGRHDCRVCSTPLPKRRRIYCSDACWREYVRTTEMEGTEITSPAPPRVYRTRLG